MNVSIAMSSMVLGGMAAYAIAALTISWLRRSRRRERLARRAILDRDEWMASEMPELQVKDADTVWEFLDALALCFAVSPGQLRATDEFHHALGGGDVDLDVERFLFEEEMLPNILPPDTLAEFVRRRPVSIREAVHLLVSRSREDSS